MSHCHLELVRKLNLFHFVFLNNIKMRLLTLLFLVLDTPCCQKTNTTSKACKIPTPSLCHSSPPRKKVSTIKINFSLTWRLFEQIITKFSEFFPFSFISISAPLHECNEDINCDTRAKCDEG